ncbi:hypothetical protein ACQ86B_28275 (plasmid) [Mycolicibacterium aichiense]|uniref:hypothetical protein n=1 Tax=Mycolicibacterium aichiense TaxID=1799 RepID=UPI003D674F01
MTVAVRRRLPKGSPKMHNAHRHLSHGLTVACVGLAVAAPLSVAYPGKSTPVVSDVPVQPAALVSSLPNPSVNRIAADGSFWLVTGDVLAVADAELRSIGATVQAATTATQAVLLAIPAVEGPVIHGLFSPGKPRERRSKTKSAPPTNCIWQLPTAHPR